MSKNDIIYNYIDNNLLRGLHLGGDAPKIWCIDKDVIFMHDLNDSWGLNVLYVSDKIWNELRDMFSLHTEQTNDLIKGWSIRNLGVSRHVTLTVGFF